MKGFALGLALKQRQNATWKLPICLLAQECLQLPSLHSDVRGRGRGRREEGGRERLQQRPTLDIAPSPTPLCATAQAIKCLVQYILYIYDHNCPKIHHESIEAYSYSLLMIHSDLSYMYLLGTVTLHKF